MENISTCLDNIAGTGQFIFNAAVELI